MGIIKGFVNGFTQGWHKKDDSYLAQVKNFEREFNSAQRKILGKTRFSSLKAAFGIDKDLMSLVQRESEILAGIASVTESAASSHFETRDKMVNYFRTISNEMSEVLEELESLRNIERPEIGEIDFSNLESRLALENASATLIRNTESMQIDGRERQLREITNRYKGHLKDAEFIAVLYTKHAVLLEMISDIFSSHADYFGQIIPAYVQLAETYKSYASLRNILSGVNNTTLYLGSDVQKTVRVIGDSSRDLVVPELRISTPKSSRNLPAAASIQESSSIEYQASTPRIFQKRYFARK